MPSAKDALVRDLQHRLSLVAEVDLEAISPAPVPSWLVGGLSELFSSRRFGAMRPRGARDYWSLGDFVSTENDAVFPRYDAILRQHPMPVPFGFDPMRPAASQRNRVMALDEIHTHGPDITCSMEDLWPKVGLWGHDQLRALVCDGPVLLAWVGGFREEPFTSRERAQLEALVLPMQRALALRRALLDAGLASEGLTAALEEIGAPAFIARRDGTILFASASGVALFECAGRSFTSRLRGVIDSSLRATAPVDERHGLRDRARDLAREHVESPSSVTRLSGAGASERYLIILREPESALHVRLAEARRRWKISPRETEVLRLVVAGDSNKEIALKLGIHEGSVERHVTSLLRKLRTDSRSRLIAKFWTTR